LAIPDLNENVLFFSLLDEVTLQQVQTVCAAKNGTFTLEDVLDMNSLIDCKVLTGNLIL
jgi:hypothetical protein